MKQLTQKLGSGEMIIQEVPFPQLGKGMILVKNHYSIISSGTEGSTVRAARKSLIGKAKERPQQVKQVVDTFNKLGPVQTYRAVMKKLDAYSPLGYSCAGEVVNVGEGVTNFKIGDKVACAGIGYANHAEVVAVPTNLAVKLSNNANLKDAAYNTLGAIAMQGVRQADMRLGETCIVIGLGLLGQLTSLILKASGVNVIGIDVSESAVNLANKNDVCDYTFTRNSPGIDEKIMTLTKGLGADATIIAAATSSTDPINFAGKITRKKGTVVILGAVPTGFDRDPYWYKKELELKMACSYGPGRYDLNYEEKGIDYPAPYVRWTQNRNMQSFQELLSKNVIDIKYMTTHEFDFNEANKAYDLVLERTEPFIGIALKYDVNFNSSNQKIKTEGVNNFPEARLNISFVGAGSYAQSNLLPNLQQVDNANRIGVLTRSGTTSKRVAEKFKFQFCTSNEQDIFNENTNTLFIATRHDSHGTYVLKGLKHEKHIFVEKPLCLKEDELEEIIEEQKKSGRAVMIGFNRRFSPLTRKIKKALGDGPMSMIYRVNAGTIPKESWIQDIEIGGGRILGEVCHFIDYLTYLCDSNPVNVSAQVLNDPENLNDTVNILLKFKNGSTGVICYYSNGSKSLAKEYVEVYSSGVTAILNDFKSLQVYGKEKPAKSKLLNQNKGQKIMVEKFLNSISNDGSSPIPFNEIVAVTRASFKVLDSISQNGAMIKI